jgi:type I restriction enzyme M protein
MKDRVLRDFSPEDTEKIAGTFREWRDGSHADVSGFSKSANIQDIAKHEHVLTPGRFVGAEDVEADGEPFEEKMARLTEALSEQFDLSLELEKAIKTNLEGLGYNV